MSHEIWEVVIKGNKKRKEELKKKIEKMKKFFFDNVLIKIEQKEWIISLEVIFFFF